MSLIQAVPPALSYPSDGNPPIEVELNLWEHFSLKDALAAFYRELYKMVSYETEEQHTYHVYRRDLQVFFDFLVQYSLERLDPFGEAAQIVSRFELPSEQEVKDLDYQAAVPGELYFPDRVVVDEYITMLRLRGCKNRTINRYLASVKMFIKKLIDSRQKRKILMLTDPVQMYLLTQLYAKLDDIKTELHALATLPSLKFQRKADKSWLQEDQIKAVFKAIGREKLIDLRDRAMLMIFTHAALRLAEVGRLTLANFEPNSERTWVIKVRRKRSKDLGVSCATRAYQAVLDYVAAYNAQLPDGDPRRIAGDAPLWRALKRDGSIPESITEATSPLTTRNISKRVGTRTARVGFQVSPHEVRHTVASLANSKGMDIAQIRDFMGHESIATTNDYIHTVDEYDLLNPVLYGYLADLG